MRKYNLHLFKRIAVYVIIATGLLSVLFAAILYLNVRKSLPGMDELGNIRHHQASQVLSEDGKLLGSYFFQNRTQVDLEEISPLFIDALLAVEDIRFYEHNGIDRRALARVLVKSILLRQDAGGGSTLTQQLAKNLYPRNGPGVINLVSDKIREMIIARRLETLYNKDEILELYLNTVSFGEETFGIETASHRFFSKPSIDLELHEAAALAGVLRAPGLYNPHRNPERSELRRNVVLRQMERYGMITKDEADLHIDKPLETEYNRITENEGPATYFREHLRIQLQELLNSEPAMDGNFYNIFTDGLIIQTTIHYGIQSAAEQALTHRMRLLQEAFNNQRKDSVLLRENDPAIISAWKRSDHYQKLVDQGLPEDQIEEIFHATRPMNVFTWDGEEERELSPHDSLRHYLSFLNAGFLAITPDSGKVQAWVGGIKHKYFQYDHVKSKRQTGSAFKPVVYAAALENGMQPCDYQRNLLSTYEAYEEWTPRNIREEYGGRYSLQAALARSVNTIAVDVLMETGIGRIQQVALDMGIQSRIPGEPSIALGTAEISLLEMITAYASFASGGYRTYPYYLKAIYDSDGSLLYSFDNPNTMNPVRERALSEETASAMVSMLSKAVDEGTGHPLRSQFGITHALAGKTGTTQEFTDGWFIGTTPNLVFGSWVGGWTPRIRFSEGFLGYASQTALPIAGEFLVNLQKDSTMTPQPDYFHTHQVNSRFNTQCEDYRDDSALDKIQDFFTGRNTDEARTVRPESERKNIIDRIRDLFRKN